MQSKNLTIMFTDIKGFTARVSDGTRQDVVNLRALNDRLIRPVIEHFGGNVVKTIGDAFLASFDSPTDGVLCGVTILEVLRQHNQVAVEVNQLEVRVAINSGDVEVSDDDVHGEAVNIAARLESVAEAGEVYFTEAVYLAMNRNEAPSAEMGEQLFKGIPYPIKVYKVIQDPDAPLGKRLSEEVEISDSGPVLRSERVAAAIAAVPAGKKFRFDWRITAVAAAILVAVAVPYLAPGAAQKAHREALVAMERNNPELALEVTEKAERAGHGSPELSVVAVSAAKDIVKTKYDSGGPIAALNWLQEARARSRSLDTMSGKVIELDAQGTAQKVIHRLVDSERAIEDLLARYPNNPSVPYVAASTLRKHDWFLATYLFRRALAMGASDVDGEAFAYCKRGFRKFSPGNSRNCHEILEKYYTTQRLDWAQKIIRETTSGQEFLNAWHILADVSDPLRNDEYLVLMYDLLDGYSDEEEANAAFAKFKSIGEEDRARVLGLHAWVLDPQDVAGWGWSRKDLIERNHRELRVAWNVEG
ncbi:MAG: adenylate/guanylate cyclase domain-containing protein [Gammaproteobacteria bacterium]|nr:adenylate/guanylate cyclase domain-containing protein [Gammaproteobacteria bacterium]